MVERNFKCVYGPVPSRRLGRSLGVDLVPFKNCSYDCIYCQLGRTTNKTVERKEYVPVADVLLEIERKLDSGTPPDYITLSGSGEPTLCSELQRVISGIKETTQIPLAVLTNGSLLWDRRIQENLLEADLVIPSLDAGDEAMFLYVNRPHPNITFEKMVNGLVEFRKRFSNKIWLEVFLLEGVTGKSSQVERIASHVKRIRPDKVQLNTVTRPPSEDFASPLSQERMQELAKMFGENAEVIADYGRVSRQKASVVSREDVLGLLKRRPCSLDDIAAGLAINRNEAVKHIQHLMDEGVIGAETRDKKVFYVTK